MSVIERRATRRSASTWVVIGALAALAWAITVRQARGMGVGPGTMGMTLPLFLAMWVVMMGAMMLPSVAPTAILWTRVIRQRSEGARRAGRMASFLSGYLLAWAAYGLAAYLLVAWAGGLAETAPVAARWVGTGLFAAASLYQLTPLKQACLARCRSPIGSLVHYSGFRGPARDLRVGLHHGLYCVGCCWGLMIVLVAVGVMNVAAMAALAAVIALEKLWRHGALLSRVVGVGFLVVAALAPFHPWLLPGLRIGGMPGM